MFIIQIQKLPPALLACKCVHRNTTFVCFQLSAHSRSNYRWRNNKVSATQNFKCDQTQNQKMFWKAVWIDFVTFFSANLFSSCRFKRSLSSCLCNRMSLSNCTCSFQLLRNDFGRANLLMPFRMLANDSISSAHSSHTSMFAEVSNPDPLAHNKLNLLANVFTPLHRVCWTISLAVTQVRSKYKNFILSTFLNSIQFEITENEIV